ncbi:hypothetical protein KC19_4G199900 [Ceratodon purpureus]|uniref:Uncharacterized protein n=1 Tax=Ceratodon purpureus TaxID=3225 RepID=A0A8T0IAS2_CERPU|nr:hypothetical protein KC19_4G199900 [Ceratodon purpureus]
MANPCLIQFYKSLVLLLYMWRSSYCRSFQHMSCETLKHYQINRVFYHENLLFNNAVFCS